MPHIHAKPGQIDQSVTAFVVRVDLSEPKILLHRHRKLAVLLPPGGHVELDETPWMAMAHELLEEAGYGLGELRIIQPKIRLKHLSGVRLHPIPLVTNTHHIAKEHFHTDLGYLFIAEGEPASLPQAGESADLLWLSRDQVATLSSQEIFENTRETMLFLFDQVLGSADFEVLPATSFSAEMPVV